MAVPSQAGNDQDRKGFCAVHSTLVRLTSTSKILYTDAEQENVEKKCTNVCKKVRKGNNSHKEGRNILCMAYGKKFILHDDPPGPSQMSGSGACSAPKGLLINLGFLINPVFFTNSTGFLIT